jgi:hypothetical protein
MRLENLFKRINSVSFLQVTTDDGRTVLFIPAWAAAAAIILFIVLVRTWRAKRS